jgi:predicted metal-binding membrane protein
VHWLLMLAAMMAPVLIQPIQFIRSQGFARRRIRATLLFVMGYASIWMIAGMVMFSIAATARAIGLSPVISVTAVVGTAIVWQCSPAKQICLNRCHVRPALAAFGRRADAGAILFGATYGGWCIQSCAAWMLVPLVVPGAHIAAMVAAAVLIFCERLDRPARPAWQWRGLGTAWRVVATHLRMQQGADRAVAGPS